MSPRNKNESALGKGLDALIRKDYLDKEEKQDKSEEYVKKTSKTTERTELDETPDDSINTADTEKFIQDSERINVDEKIIEVVLMEVHKNPRISLWSAKSAAVLRFLKKTKPEFSISSEASLLIEEAVKNRHPEIWKLFEEKGL